jgi:hypothetical protein
VDRLDAWDVALYLAAGYVAVIALVRLMLNERARLTEKFRSEMLAERHRQAQAEQQRKKEDAKTRSGRGAA